MALAVIFLVGCEHSRTGIRDSTERYLQVFWKRMEKFGPVQKISDRTSATEDGDALRMIRFSVPTKNFPPERLAGEMAATFREIDQGRSTSSEQGADGGENYGVGYSNDQGDAYIGGWVASSGERTEIQIEIIIAKPEERRRR